MNILIYRRIYFYKVLTQGLTQGLWRGLCRGLCPGLCRGLTPSESPSIYQYIASIYMVHCSVYMVHCSIYHAFLYIPGLLLYIPCSLLYIHDLLLYIPCFPRKKRICKIMYNLGIRTHDLMQTARPRWPLHHERWYKTVFVHGISMFDSALLGVRHLAAGVGHPARGPPRRPLRPWRHRHGPSSSLRFPGLLTQKSWHSGSRTCCRPLDSNLKLELPSVLAARPSAMRTAGTSLLKPDSTPLQNKIKLSASLRAGSSILKNLCY